MNSIYFEKAILQKFEFFIKKRQWIKSTSYNFTIVKNRFEVS